MCLRSLKSSQVSVHRTPPSPCVLLYWINLCTVWDVLDFHSTAHTAFHRYFTTHLKIEHEGLILKWLCCSQQCQLRRPSGWSRCWAISICVTNPPDRPLTWVVTQVCVWRTKVQLGHIGMDWEDHRCIYLDASIYLYIYFEVAIMLRWSNDRALFFF